MITITKQNDGVLFEFEDSKKYLYGNGSILVPFNTLSIVADESDMITLKKAASNDVFLSARYDTDFGYRSKDDAIDDLKDLLFAETGGGSGSGITSGDVETMIDAALDDYYDKDEVDAGFDSVNATLSGKADTAVVNQAISEATQAILAVSGDVQTKLETSDFNTYSAATDSRLAEDEEVTAAALNDLQENKADTSAVTAAIDAAITGKVDTSAITSAITSGSTDAEIPTAKAVYDAIPTGGGATYSAGTNISIDTGNTISCTLPITANTSNRNVTVGYYLNVRQDGESSIGVFNVNRFVNATTHSENTIFTVGNGGSNHYRHNALEIRKSGDLYFADTSNNGQSYYEKPMVRLQDMYAALGGLKFVKLTQNEYDQLATKDPDTLYIISNVVS